MRDSLLESLELLEVPVVGSEHVEPLATRLEARRFNLADPPPKPQSRFYLNGVGLCTPGNLTAVSAAVKSGKSGFLGAMMAAVLAPDSDGLDCLGVTSSNPEATALIHLDTEQSPYDHHDLVRRSLRRAGMEEPPAWFCSYCLTGFPYDEVRHAVALLLTQAVERFGGVHSMLIDGVADLVSDVNDPQESNGLVTELHRHAIKFHCPLINVIHVNPGGEKTRGHLGSQLERKAETNLRLEKEGELTVVWSDKNRRAPILKEQGPRFEWSVAQGMHVRVASLAQGRDDLRRQGLRDLAEATLNEAGRPNLSWKEWIEAIMQTAKLGSASTAEKRFDAMRKLGVVEKTAFGRWKLSEPPTPK